MRRCLILVVLLAIAQLNGLRAQTTFTAPDTVCIRQPISLKANDTNASSYYWSFCSGYLMDRPTGNSLGLTFGLNDARDIEVGKDNDGLYYGFFINRAVPELIRLDFGRSLNNTPTVHSLGNLGGTIPVEANSLFLTKDAVGQWVMFAVSGATSASSSIFRMDFYGKLSNTPNCVNMGNLGGLLNGPKGFFVTREGTYWHGFSVNSLDNKLIRYDFGTNISNTPNTVDLGNPDATLSEPSDLAAIRDNDGNWHFFVTNYLTNNLVEMLVGPSLTAMPSGSVLAPDPDSMSRPTSIVMARECGVDYAFITNEGSSRLLRVAFTDLPTLKFKDVTWQNIAGVRQATAMSHVIRDKDNLYALVTNIDNSLGRINFANCTSTMEGLSSSTEKNPPSFSYSRPGTYSVFLSKDEGLPTASMECHTITALPLPAITIVTDMTICQGDTADLFAIAVGTDTLKWLPTYNNTNPITTVDALGTRVFPEYSRAYHFIAMYPNGCIIDSPIQVTVNKVKADAGIDRVVGDGSVTVLGGPMTTQGPEYSIQWSPINFLNDPRSANPSSEPFYDVTYVMTVASDKGCVSTDTVSVRIECTDITLPNAFTPEDHSAGNDYFGIINKNIVKLTQFKIFDRWGREVFSTTDISEKWDGKYKGEDCAYGVYVWTVDGFCAAGKRVNKSGNVTLLR